MSENKQYILIPFEEGNLIFKDDSREFFNSVDCLKDNEIVDLLNELSEENTMLKKANLNLRDNNTDLRRENEQLKRQNKHLSNIIECLERGSCRSIDNELLNEYGLNEDDLFYGDD